MTESTDPNAAPMHHDVREKYASGHVMLALVAGLVATAVGLILGLTLVNN